MSSSLADAVQKFINSPPGHLVAAGVLAGTVWKIFDRIEGVLTDSAKLEIAAWLTGVRVSPQLEQWPEVFENEFIHAFGEKQWSWSSAWRFSLFSLMILLGTATWHFAGHPALRMSFLRLVRSYPSLFAVAIISDIVLSYAWFSYTRTVMKLRRLLRKIRKIAVNYAEDDDTSNVWFGGSWRYSVLILWVIICQVSSACVAVLLVGFGYLWVDLWITNAEYHSFFFDLYSGLWREIWWHLWWVWVFPPLFTCGLLWLYSVSGLLIRTARRFDTVFGFINRKFDIQKKPLSTIGLVAGVLAASAYWAGISAIYVFSWIAHTR